MFLSSENVQRQNNFTEMFLAATEGMYSLLYKIVDTYKNLLKQNILKIICFGIFFGKNISSHSFIS